MYFKYMDKKKDVFGYMSVNNSEPTEDNNVGSFIKPEKVCFNGEKTSSGSFKASTLFLSL